MEEFTLSEERVNGGFVAHLYNALLPAAVAAGGAGELSFGGDRAAIRIRAPEGAQIKQAAAEAVAEIVARGGFPDKSPNEKPFDSKRAREEEIYSIRVNIIVTIVIIVRLFLF